MTARDTAIERRNLTTAQRVDIVLRSEELVKGIEIKAHERMVSGKKKTLGPTGPNEKPIQTDVSLSKLANTSKSRWDQKIPTPNPRGPKDLIG